MSHHPMHHELDACDTASATVDWASTDVNTDSVEAVLADAEAFAARFHQEGETTHDPKITVEVLQLVGPGGGWPEVKFTGPVDTMCALYASYMAVRVDAEVDA